MAIFISHPCLAQVWDLSALPEVRTRLHQTEINPVVSVTLRDLLRLSISSENPPKGETTGATEQPGKDSSAWSVCCFTSSQTLRAEHNRAFREKGFPTTPREKLHEERGTGWLKRSSASTFCCVISVRQVAPPSELVLALHSKKA